MTVKEIVLLEEENVKNIYLFREGIFYRAYNRSAMRVVETIKSFKINHKYVKTVQQVIFYIGFPCTSFETISIIAANKGWRLMSTSTAESEKMITLWCESIGNENYDDWIKTKGQAASQPLENLQQRIVNFPIERATPLEAMMFLNNLKNQIKDDNV